MKANDYFNALSKKQRPSGLDGPCTWATIAKYLVQPVPEKPETSVLKKKFNVYYNDEWIMSSLAEGLSYADRKILEKLARIGYKIERRIRNVYSISKAKNTYRTKFLNIHFSASYPRLDLNIFDKHKSDSASLRINYYDTTKLSKDYWFKKFVGDIDTILTGIDNGLNPETILHNFNMAKLFNTLE
jgi:hypothetical protein